jgi:ferrous iron transport protein B
MSSTQKIILAGNHNVGKSLVFSRCTGIGVISSNYPGTTVAVKTGKVKYSETEYTLFDIAGVYSLEHLSGTDENVIRLIDESDIIINVVDATNLERNLHLTMQLLARNKPMIVCLNYWDDTKHKGIAIDPAALENSLGVPVVTASALSGEGIKELVAALPRAKKSNVVTRHGDEWNTIGKIIANVQKIEHRHHTFLERLSDISIHPIGGIVTAAVVLLVTFLIIRGLGEWMVNRVCDPVFVRYYNPFVHHWGALIPFDIIREMLIGHTDDPLLSFGVLTTGAYIALVLVFPYFFSFYLIFGFLEDFGYLPRLAVVLDAVFHRIGLHGYSSIPVMLGLGCKVPAFLATRVLTSKREKILTMSLILMSAPCLPQSAMIISLGMPYGVATVSAIFAILFIFALITNTLLNKVMKGEVTEMFAEIPPYRIPSVKMLAKKLKLRVVEYFVEVGPMIIVGVLIIHILDSLKIINALSVLVGRPVSLLLGVPHDIAPVLVLGFLRKDVSIALLAPFNLNSHQFIIASIFMVLYIPCIASFFTLIKELGFAAAIKTVTVVFVSAIGVTALLNAFFTFVLKV